MSNNNNITYTAGTWNPTSKLHVEYSCNTDMDCPPGMICVNNVCINPPEPPQLEGKGTDDEVKTATEIWRKMI